ncbi:MAG: crossover junction endodeoxyribonuclease RuvC [Alphaproteobacteria bacterium]|nr:crossover junction endodeoxyribonuclease RuvC [Alphaproteobacteria bacterium]
MIILGIDPGLRFTGWGVIERRGNSLVHIANGTIKVPEKAPMSERLKLIHDGLREVVEKFAPSAAAIEDVFVNMNPQSTLKLGAARGVAFVVPALFGIPVAEFSPNLVKKSITGVGHATKEQIQMMVGVLLGKPATDSEHSADALAIAITRAHS